MIQQILQTARQHQQEGRLADAEKLYHQTLRQQPDNAEAMLLLGVLMFQTGRLVQAEQLIRRAIAKDPNQAPYHGNLGVVLAALQRGDEAIAAYRQALSLQPDYVSAHMNLGNALRAKGQFPQAIAEYQQTLRLNPDYAEAHNNLANALRESGQLDSAIAAYQKSLELKPKQPEAFYNLGTALRAKGDWNEAVAAFNQAISLRSDYAEAYNNLGNVLRDKDDLDGAIAAYRQALTLDIKNGLTFYNLASVMRDKGGLVDGVIAALRQAAELRPDDPDVFYELGNALRLGDEPKAAVAALHRALELRPNHSDTYHSLGSVYKGLGRLDEALENYDKALELSPHDWTALSNRIYTIYFHQDYDGARILKEHQEWDKRFGLPLAKEILPHSNHRDPDRKLRIGYVSPDYRRHCQSFFTIPLLSHHDHQNFEIYGYSQVPRPDEITEQIKGYTDAWKSTTKLSDAAVAGMIRADQIDILVDLTMHMSNCRPLTFARKPAPIQVAWLAYPGTTGISAIDYRFTDPYLDPPGMNDEFYTEKSYRLPDTFWCYDPLINGPGVNELPALSSGRITFGCLNNFCKVNNITLGLWAAVLAAVPRSRLILLSPQGEHRQKALDRLQVDPKRVDFVCYEMRPLYLHRYHQIDIGLDTFPYNGHTTSLDSLWMGVPVVSLMDQTAASRAGFSQSSNLGLVNELVAKTPEQFVEIAVRLSRDLDGLSRLRSKLRGKMEKSPLMDGAKFATGVEAAYRDMWRNFCQSKA
jgi:protein O-GlcNAc transferase